MKFLILPLTLAVMSFQASAAWKTGEITGYIPYSEGLKEIIIFKLNENPIGGCNTTGRFAMDSNSPRYKASVTAIISAFHSKTPVRVNYLSTCNSWVNSADASFICIGSINC
ncbi:hypothetical protein [Enterovibrio baiacu]|uniref:hypothetical protein n=1 Tax=Enterovibrio baiacu TaxID=2491023 RepID=UPI003D13F90D